MPRRRFSSGTSLNPSLSKKAKVSLKSAFCMEHAVEGYSSVSVVLPPYAECRTLKGEEPVGGGGDSDRQADG